MVSSFFVTGLAITIFKQKKRSLVSSFLLLVAMPGAPSTPMSTESWGRNPTRIPQQKNTDFGTGAVRG